MDYRHHHGSRLHRRLSGISWIVILDATDFIIGEEVSAGCRTATSKCTSRCMAPTSALHRELQKPRGIVLEVTAPLRERAVFFALNHLMHFYRGQIPLQSYHAAAGRGAGAGKRGNGDDATEAHNALIEDIAQG